MKSFVVVPTYNEAGNIERLIHELFALGAAGLNVLVVDDSSPDGTSRIVEKLAADLPGLFLVERIGQKGRGTAGIVGFEIALKLGSEAIIEMDADFSHPPATVPELLGALSGADIAIASRLAPGSKDDRPWPRRVLTRFANSYARAFSQKKEHVSKVADWTTGFRAYRREVFEKVPPRSLVSRGPSILQEILFRSLNQGMSATEIAFDMVDRKVGQSSFNRKIALQSLAAIPAYRAIFGGVGPEFDLLQVHSEQKNSQHYLCR